MCSNGSMYLDEEEFLKEEDENFYNTTDDKWDYYSGLPNPSAYENN